MARNARILSIWPLVALAGASHYWGTVFHHVLHVLKFFGVMLFAGGSVASFVARDSVDRRLAVHALATPGLLLTWAAGYALSLTLGVGLRELWTFGGLVLSFVAHLALLRSVNHMRSAFAIGSVALPLFAVLLLMVFRPTWAGIL